ncbi:MAG TPA: MFS transporter [Salinisphaeraceae bacterium]|nr:MFS transporter [Salinisphaeraceae bacterium]
MGKKRRIIGAICLDLAISTLFIWNIFVNPLAHNLDLSLSEVNYIFAFGLAFFSMGAIIGGYATDFISPSFLALISGIGMVGGLWLAAIAPSFIWVVIGFGLLHGSATGLGYATAVHEAGIINHGLALALVVSAYGVGSVLLAQPISWLIAVSSYHIAFAALGVFSAAVCGLAVFLLPKQVILGDQAPMSRKKPEDVSHLAGLLLLLWLMFGLGSAPGLITFALAGALTGGASSSSVIAVNFGNLSGRILAGILSNRLGASCVLHGNCALLVAACGMLVFAESRWVADISLLMIGLQYGALSTLLPLLLRKGVPVTVFGRCFGIVFSAWGVCGLIAPVVASMLLGFGGISWVILIMIACIILSWLAWVTSQYKYSQ